MIVLTTNRKNPLIASAWIGLMYLQTILRFNCIMTKHEFPIIAYTYAILG